VSGYIGYSLKLFYFFLFVGFDGLFVVVEVSKNEKNKTIIETYYIPTYNIIYITPEQPSKQ